MSSNSTRNRSQVISTASSAFPACSRPLVSPASAARRTNVIASSVRPASCSMLAACPSAVVWPASAAAT